MSVTSTVSNENSSIASPIDESMLFEDLYDYERTKGSPHMRVSKRFRIEMQFFEEVKKRFWSMEHCLRPGIEYKPEELIFGSLFGEAGFCDSPEIVLSLKHLAAQPNAPLVEVQWGTFRLSTDKDRTAQR